VIRFLRRLGLALAALLLVGGGTVALLGETAAPGLRTWWRQAAGLTLPLPGRLALVDAVSGRPFTDADLRGRWTLLYFGYTFCPDVCPTDLAAAVQALALMGKKANAVTPVFVTVDPARDTPDVLARYVQLFSPRLMGLTGSAAAIAEAERMFRVYAVKQPIPQGGGAYLMNHSAYFYLVDPAGDVASMLSPDLQPRGLARAIEEKLNRHQ
jgi:protein SCO1/2